VAGPGDGLELKLGSSGARANNSLRPRVQWLGWNLLVSSSELVLSVLRRSEGDSEVGSTKL
jgi:hypothetical protein